MDQSDINEIFEDIALSENKFTDKGFSEGVEEGLKKSYSEGDQLGRDRGKQIGQEIGFYKGFVAEFKTQVTDKSDKKSEKILNVIRKIETLTNEFPEYNCKEGFEEKLEELRAKFKLLCSLLKINSEFNLNKTSW